MFYVDVQRRGRGELKKTGPDVIPGDVQRRGRGGLKKQDRILFQPGKEGEGRGGLEKQDRILFQGEAGNWCRSRIIVSVENHKVGGKQKAVSHVYIALDQLLSENAS